MANWVNIITSSFNGSDAGYDQNLKVTLQYDKDRTTPISTVVRFYTYVGNPMKDGYYILWDPGKSTERLLKGKRQDTYLKNNYSTEFTITKKYSEEIYTIPPYWICHCGAVTPRGLEEIGVASHIIYYGTNNEQTVYHYFTNSRRNYKTVVSSVDFDVKEVENAVATAVGTGTVSIADNYNNSYTVTGTRGSAGTSNAVNGALLYWTHTKKSDGSWLYSKASNSEEFKTISHSKTISFTPSTAAEREVVGAVVTDGEYNDTDSGWKPSPPAKIKQYLVPGKPGDISVSYNKSRLTIKEPWTFKWGAATKANDSSTVKGYRIRIYRKRGTGSWATIDFHDASNNKLTSGTTDKVYTRDGGSTLSFVLSNPAKYFLPGDQVQVKVVAYTKYGKNNDGSVTDSDGNSLLYNDSNISVSPVWTVLNAGVMRVKPTTTSGIKEGVVWVKVLKNGVAQWVEADIVKTKTASTVWSEST